MVRTNMPWQRMIAIPIITMPTAARWGRVLDGNGYTLAYNGELADRVVPPADTNLHPDPHRNHHGDAGPRSRIYDGYCTENPDVYIAVKTSIGGVT